MTYIFHFRFYPGTIRVRKLPRKLKTKHVLVRFGVSWFLAKPRQIPTKTTGAAAARLAFGAKLLFLRCPGVLVQVQTRHKREKPYKSMAAIARKAHYVKLTILVGDGQNLDSAIGGNA